MGRQSTEILRCAQNDRWAQNHGVGRHSTEILRCAQNDRWAQNDREGRHSTEILRCSNDDPVRPPAGVGGNQQAEADCRGRGGTDAKTF